MIFSYHNFIMRKRKPQESQEHAIHDRQLTSQKLSKTKSKFRKYFQLNFNGIPYKRLSCTTNLTNQSFKACRKIIKKCFPQTDFKVLKLFAD